MKGANKFKNYKLTILFIIITVLSIYVRYLFLEFKSNDYNMFLEQWFYALKNNGGLWALKNSIGNYNAPYLTIMAILTYLPIRPIISIKIVSIIFDYICAAAVMKIVYIILKENKNRNIIAVISYGIILFLPTVLLNSSCWGQADSIYTAFILLSIIFLLKEKYKISFILLGISFAFKLQFIFILPLYIYIYVSEKKFPLYYFGIIILVNMIMCIPSIIFGKSVISCIEVYFMQMASYSNELSLNIPNIYNLIFRVGELNRVVTYNIYTEAVMISITLFIFILMYYLILNRKIKFNNQKIIEFGLWSVMIAVFFLPHMHERYLYVGDILSVIYFVFNKDKWYVPVGVSCVSLYGYMTFLTNHYSIIPIQLVSFIYLLLVIIVTKDIYNKYLKKESKE